MLNSTMLSQKNLDRLERMCLYDDKYMTVVLGQSIPCTQLVLSIILGNPVHLVHVQPQQHIVNLNAGGVRGRNAILDIVAFDANGVTYDLEIQVKPNSNLLKRARYYASMTDVQMLREGVDYELLPEQHVVFVTKTDYYKKAKPQYPFECRCRHLADEENTGVLITFVNGAHMDDTPLGRLMHDMACANPDKMYYDELAKRCAFIKRTPQGRQIMTGVFAEIYEEGREEGREEGLAQGKETGVNEERQRIAMQLVQNTDFSIDVIAKCTGMSVASVENLRMMCAGGERS